MKSNVCRKFAHCFVLQTKNRKQRWLLTFLKTNQNTQEVNNERFLISTRQNHVRIFGIPCLINKATNPQTCAETSQFVLSCLVKKRSFFVASCVFWFLFLKASSHLCFPFVFKYSIRIRMKLLSVLLLLFWRVMMQLKCFFSSKIYPVYPQIKKFPLICTDTP